ncbi:hypothetical protein BH24ACI3_BH24ACI3_03720 [soil metagenome]
MEVEHRLDILQMETERLRSQSTETISHESGTVSRAVDSAKAHAFFGLTLGLIPTTAVFAKLFNFGSTFRIEDIWILIPAALAVAGTSWVGWRFGGLAACWVERAGDSGISTIILTIPLIGAVWGLAAGTVGGAFMFVFGAIFGAVIGAAVGTVSLPIFTLFHQLLKQDDDIDVRHLLPLSFGISSVVAAFVLGL